MALRDDINNANPNFIADLLRRLGLGELLVFLLNAATFTETALTVTASKMTLAAIPTALFRVNATTATTTGEKKLIKGPITGPNAIVPATGECVWDGATTILFAAADVVTVGKALYSKAADVSPSCLKQDFTPLT
jgi:hypothetical protein